jgi:hypothetical protein
MLEGHTSVKAEGPISYLKLHCRAPLRLAEGSTDDPDQGEDIGRPTR